MKKPYSGLVSECAGKQIKKTHTLQIRRQAYDKRGKSYAGVLSQTILCLWLQTLLLADKNRTKVFK